MTHHATSRFWSCYEQLPEEVRSQADKQFALLNAKLMFLEQHMVLHYSHVVKRKA